ncbi:possible arabinosidase [Lachnospiraceae bacterium KM106-2]|nr:possible arabinosidase [Lachnospiraceae bacterium KM106-2]
MTEKDGKLVDVSGNGLDGTCIGLSDANFVTEDNEKVLEFTGDKGQFVKLPKGCIPGEEFTIEASVKTDVRADHWLYCFGTKEGKYPNVNNYIFCNPNQNNGTIRMGLKNSDKELLSQKGKIESGKYNTITATFKDGVMAVYVNGKFIESVKHDYKIMDILKNGVENEEDCIGYLGKSIFTPDPAFTGKLSDFKIYNYAKSEDEITKVEEKTDQEIVDLAKRELNIPDASNIRGNVTLPTSLEGAAISWKSSNEAIISTAVKENKNYDETPAGVVTRQAEDTKVTITATISYKEITTTKEFTLTVKAKAKKLTNEDYGGYLFVHFTGESDEGE